jgi:S1-C subfamily serine protease
MRFSATLAPLPATTVSEVWDGWPAAQSGIEPGDEVLSVDDRPTPLPQDAVSLLMRSPSSEHDLRIRRGRRNLALHIGSMGLLEASNVRPAVYIEDTEGLTIARVPKGSSADNAGLLPSDRLLVVDGRPATKQLVERAFGQFRVAAPVTVIVRRPGRRLLVQVLP